MSLASRSSSRSRTQPPTMSARPPASRTVVAICVAWWRDSDMIAANRLTAVFLHEPIAEARCDGVQQHETASFHIRIDLGNRMGNRAGNGASHVFGRLLRPGR